MPRYATHVGDYHRLGETLRTGLRESKGSALRRRRRERAAPVGPLSNHAGPAPEEVEFGPGSFVPLKHGSGGSQCRP